MRPREGLLLVAIPTDVYYLSVMPVKKTSPVKKNPAKAPSKKAAPSVYVSAYDLAKEAKAQSKKLIAKASAVTGGLVEKVESLLGVASKKKAPAKKAIAKKAPAAKAPTKKAVAAKTPKKAAPARTKDPAAKKAPAKRKSKA